MKKLITLLALIGLAFLLNPGPQAHRNKLKAEISARNQLAGLLQVGSLAAMASSYHSLGIASYATLNDKTVSYGALGVVFVPDLSAK